jgi:hypothetical protein
VTLRKEIKYFLLSLIIGLLTLAVLLSFCYYTAKHQDSIFAIVGYVMAFLLSIPILFYCGADCNPPAAILVATGLFDTLCLSTPIYVALLTWGARKVSVQQ